MQKSGCVFVLLPDVRDCRVNCRVDCRGSCDSNLPPKPRRHHAAFVPTLSDPPPQIARHSCASVRLVAGDVGRSLCWLDVKAEDLGGCCLSCASVRLCGRVEPSEGSRQAGGRAADAGGGTRRCKSPRPSCTTHAVQTGSAPSCALSRQVADILI